MSLPYLSCVCFHLLIHSHPTRFLDIAAGVKELSLTSAFSDMVGKFDIPATTGKGGRIPVEKSGGGI